MCDTISDKELAIAIETKIAEIDLELGDRLFDKVREIDTLRGQREKLMNVLSTLDLD